MKQFTSHHQLLRDRLLPHETSEGGRSLDGKPKSGNGDAGEYGI